MVWVLSPEEFEKPKLVASFEILCLVKFQCHIHIELTVTSEPVKIMSAMTAEYGVKWRGTKPVYCVQRDVYRCRCKVGWNTLYIHKGPCGP